MTEKEKQFNQWFDEYADGVKVFEEADMKQAYLQGRADLEKENAELKHTIATLRQEKDNVSMHTKAMEVVAKTRSDQLTKAKEIIKKLLDEFERMDVLCNYQLRTQAEQFLKETGK